MTGAIGRLAAMVLALVLASPATAQSAQAPLLPHPILAAADMRDTLDLSGPWTWSIDPYRDGLAGSALQVTGLRRDGDNRLTVGADSERAATDVPPPVTDWDNYGGITRPVSLVFTPATYVDDAWARLTRDGRIAVSMQLSGEG